MKPNQKLLSPILIDGVQLPGVYDVEIYRGTVWIKHDVVIQVRKSDLVFDIPLDPETLSREIQRLLDER